MGRPRKPRAVSIKAEAKRKGCAKPRFFAKMKLSRFAKKVNRPMFHRFT